MKSSLTLVGLDVFDDSAAILPQGCGWVFIGGEGDSVTVKDV